MRGSFPGRYLVQSDQLRHRFSGSERSAWWHLSSNGRECCASLHLLSPLLDDYRGCLSYLTRIKLRGFPAPNWDFTGATSPPLATRSGGEVRCAHAIGHPEASDPALACHCGVNHWYRNTLCDMAPRRRPRGSLVDPVPLGYVVEREAKKKLDRIADQASVSSAVMFEHLIEHLELTVRGLPVTWPEQELHDGELPIDAA